MNLTRALASLILLLCGSSCLHATKIFAQPALNLYESLNERILDDPDQAIKEAREAFQKLNPNDKVDSWLQVLMVLVKNDWNGPWMEKNPQEFLKSAKSLAEQRGYQDLALMIEATEAENKARGKGDYAEVRRHFLRYIEISEERKLDLTRAWLTTSLAYAEYEQGDLVSALRWGKVSMDVIAKVRGPEDADALSIKNTLALILESMGNKTQTIEVYEDLEQLLRKRHVRFALAIVLCNHGLLLIHNEMDSKRTEALYQEAAEIAGNLGHPYLNTLSHRGLADVLMSRQEQQKALNHLEQAMDSARKLAPDDLLRLGLFIDKAKILVELKRWQEALDTIAKGENDVTRKDKNTLRTIRYVTARAHAGLGQFEKAFKEQKEAFDLIESIHKEEREKETNKLHVQLGLELQEQKSLALKSEVQLQRQAVAIVLSLALVTIALLGFALRKAGEVRRSRARMKRVLNHIEEGLLVIGKGMQVESNLSPYLSKLLHLDPYDRSTNVFQHFMAAVDLNEDERSTLRSVLEICLGEARSTWEFNEGQLPAELSLAGNTQWLGLHWQALFNEQGEVQSILMAVRDITETRRLRFEKAAAEQKRMNAEKHLQELLLLDPREVRSFIKEFQATLQLLDTHLLAGERTVECLRALHTCKGLSRSLGFKELSLLMHDMEDQIHHPERLEGLLQQLHVIFADYELWANRLYPEGAVARHSSNLSLHEQVGRSIPALQRQLQAAGLRLASFQVDDAVLEWDLNILEKLGSMLMHGLANSVDHGFVLPRKRGQIIRDPEFLIEARVEGSEFCLRLFDNGVGLDIIKLQRLAEERGVADWREVLFQDGFSTAEQVSTTSGRGVGLAAIRQISQELEGRVSLRPHDRGPGSCLEIHVPYRAIEPISSTA